MLEIGGHPTPPIIMYGLISLGENYGEHDITLDYDKLSHSILYETIEEAKMEFFWEMIEIYKQYEYSYVPKSVKEINLYIPEILNEERSTIKLSSVHDWKEIGALDDLRLGILSYGVSGGLNLSFYAILVNMNIFNPIKITFG